MEIDKEVLDKLLANYQKPEDIVGENGLLKQLTKALVERAMEAELTTHLGYEKHDPAGYGSGNSRNGKRPEKAQRRLRRNRDRRAPRSQRQLRAENRTERHYPLHGL